MFCMQNILIFQWFPIYPSLTCFTSAKERQASPMISEFFPKSPAGFGKWPGIPEEVGAQLQPGHSWLWRQQQEPRGGNGSPEKGWEGLGGKDGGEHQERAMAGRSRWPWWLPVGDVFNYGWGPQRGLTWFIIRQANPGPPTNSGLAQPYISYIIIDQFPQSVSISFHLTL